MHSGNLHALADISALYDKVCTVCAGGRPVPDVPDELLLSRF